MIDELTSTSTELEKEVLIVQNLGMRMFIWVLFTLAEDWKAQNFLEMGNCLNNNGMGIW